MIIFVYEHISSGALCDQPLPASLLAEGNNMLLALVSDFSQLAQCDLLLLRDHRLEPLNIKQCQTVHSRQEFADYYTAHLQQADAVLIIAPETDGVLATIQQSVLDAGKQLLGCSPVATKISSDKLQCYKKLVANNIATINTVLAEEYALTYFDHNTAYIVKPRDGAGCVDTLFFADHAYVMTWLTQHSSSIDNMIVQPYIDGFNLSLNLLYSVDDVVVLSINQQDIEREAQSLALKACQVNGVDPHIFSAEQADKLARQIQQAITGLWGFVGIDLIVTDNAILVVDINPRLTTSYIGLHQSLATNPAELLFTMMKQGLNNMHITHHHAVEVLI